MVLLIFALCTFVPSVRFKRIQYSNAFFISFLHTFRRNLKIICGENQYKKEHCFFFVIIINHLLIYESIFTHPNSSLFITARPRSNWKSNTIPRTICIFPVVKKLTQFNLEIFRATTIFGGTMYTTPNKRSQIQ